MFIAQPRTSHEIANDVYAYGSALLPHLKDRGADVAHAGRLVITLRSVAILAGRASQMSDDDMRDGTLTACATRALDILRELQTIDVAATVAYREPQRAAQTNTGDGTGRMCKRAARAQWKQDKGLPLTETERKAILKRVRFQLDKEIGDNRETQRTHAEGAGISIAQIEEGLREMAIA